MWRLFAGSNLWKDAFKYKLRTPWHAVFEKKNGGWSDPRERPSPLIWRGKQCMGRVNPRHKGKLLKRDEGKLKGMRGNSQKGIAWWGEGGDLGINEVTRGKRFAKRDETNHKKFSYRLPSKWKKTYFSEIKVKIK